MVTIVKIAQEAASNPHVQAVGVAVAGALAWKVLDVYDTQANKEISAEDREAENMRHKEEMAMRERELEEARLTRIDENMRHKEEMAMRERELEVEATK